jgi:hypothetical protein
MGVYRTNLPIKVRKADKKLLKGSHVYLLIAMSPVVRRDFQAVSSVRRARRSRPTNNASYG